MSNYELRSQLNSLEHQLANARRINVELNQELATINSGIARAERTLNDYCEQVQNSLSQSGGRLASSHHRIIDSISVQAEIDRLYEMDKRIELANKKIRALGNRKYYDFANYRTIRKIVQGIMDNLDLNMVSESAIYKAVEVQHLQTPDYWLTCVLIAIMAWKSDDRPLADRALAKAVQLDKKQTAVFLMLFNIRMNRNDAAIKWFELYRECEMTGSDRRTYLLVFSLLSRSINEEADERTRARFAEFISDTIRNCVRSEEYSEASIVRLITDNFKSMKTPFSAEYPLLRKYSANTDKLLYALKYAENNKSILEFILRTVNVTAQDKNRFIKEFIDELIQAPNDVEKATYEEIELNELIIRFSGDAERANAVFREELSRRENHIDLIKEMVYWIYDKENEEINPQMRCNMLVLAKNYHISAEEAYRQDYSRGFSPVQSVTINDYTAECDLSASENEMNRIAAFFGQQRDNELALIKDWYAYIWFAVGALAIVGGIMLHPLLFAATAGGAIGGVIVLLKNRFARKATRNKFSEKTRNTGNIMNELCEEFQRFVEQYKAADAYSERIIEELSKL